MAKFANDLLADLELQYLEDNADLLTICVGEPATFDEANDLIAGGGKRCAGVAIDSSDFTGPQDHTPDGRETVLAAQTDVTVAESTGGSDADHYAILDTGSSDLLFVTTATSPLNLVAGNKINTTAITYSGADIV
jgi:hypothetical protein